MPGHCKGEQAPTSGEPHFPSWDALCSPLSNPRVSRDSGVDIKTLALTPACSSGLTVPLQSGLEPLAYSGAFRPTSCPRSTSTPTQVLTADSSVHG